MSYYRGDSRKLDGYVEGRGLYDDGVAYRPKDCERETAFADSIGGAVYGALQYATFMEKASGHNDFGDQTVVSTINVYETDEEPDYVAVHDSGFLNAASDFLVTNEVRYCNRPVKIRPTCSCPITKHDVAIATTILNAGYPFSHFRYDDLNENDYDIEIVEERLREIVEGRPGIILEYKLDEPIELYYDEFPDGLNTDVAQLMADVFEKRCLDNGWK